MQMIISSPRSHQERIGATIQQLEGTILNSNIMIFQTQFSPPAPHTTGTKAPGTLPTAMEKYLDEDSDEEGVVVFTRSRGIAVVKV